jgi:hypothetical protein
MAGVLNLGEKNKVHKSKLRHFLDNCCFQKSNSVGIPPANLQVNLLAITYAFVCSLFFYIYFFSPPYFKKSIKAEEASQLFQLHVVIFLLFWQYWV